MKKIKVLETGLANPQSSSEVFKFKTLKKAKNFIKQAVKTCLSNEVFENGLNTDKKTKKEMKAIYKNCYKIL